MNDDLEKTVLAISNSDTETAIIMFKQFFQGKALVIKESSSIRSIVEKLIGLMQEDPNLNITKIEQYVTQYVAQVGKSPKDIKYLTAAVYDELERRNTA